jgi:hypothetical protein
MPGGLKKVEKAMAAEAARELELGEAARSCMRDGVSTEEYLRMLIARGELADAVRVLAMALAKRESIWWACRCVRRGVATPKPTEAAALATAEAWVREPTEEHRRAAYTAAQAAPIATPAGCASLAVFFSGGSLAPPDVAAVPPGESLTGKTVAGAVLLAGVVSEPAKAAEKYKAFLADGLAIAEGKESWEGAGKK